MTTYFSMPYSASCIMRVLDKVESNKTIFINANASLLAKTFHSAPLLYLLSGADRKPWVRENNANDDFIKLSFFKTISFSNIPQTLLKVCAFQSKH